MGHFACSPLKPREAAGVGLVAERGLPCGLSAPGVTHSCEPSEPGWNPTSSSSSGPWGFRAPGQERASSVLPCWLPSFLARSCQPLTPDAPPRPPASATPGV